MHALPLEIVEKYKGKLPVPIVSIARELELEIYESGDFPSCQSGSIRKEEYQYVIYVNTYQSLRRKRFTIAHELAHYLKHKDRLDRGREFVSNSKQPLSEKLNRSTRIQLDKAEKKLEVEANKIAAEILMPEEMFKKIWKQSNTIEEIAVKFAVSESAATIRAKTLFNSFMT